MGFLPCKKCIPILLDVWFVINRQIFIVVGALGTQKFCENFIEFFSSANGNFLVNFWQTYFFLIIYNLGYQSSTLVDSCLSRFFFSKTRPRSARFLFCESIRYILLCDYWICNKKWRVKFKRRVIRFGIKYTALANLIIVIKTGLSLYYSIIPILNCCCWYNPSPQILYIDSYCYTKSYFKASFNHST